MKITRITEKNAEYFRGEIDEYYGKGDAGRMCFGLIDDEENAVGAAVLDGESGDAAIRYFAIGDDHRKRGYGRFFMDEIVKSLSPVLFSRVTFCEFVGLTTEKSEALGFLSHCGFTIDEGSTRRSLYDMEDIIKAYPFGNGKLPAGERLIRGAAADEKLRENVSTIGEKLEADTGYIDSDFILSMKNRYGGIIVKEDEIRAMLGVERFEDGARLESIYVGQSTMDELFYLFDYAINAIKAEEQPLKTLYIDADGKKVRQFEDAVLGRKSVGRRECFTDMIAWKTIGG
ncbi:MAG: GNAT family N-acetyltransferase [Lachnospiraceae bacterium]|nr:GNAT family N-acetyltransferase [Lachnospiraceae bacterium]